MDTQAEGVCADCTDYGTGLKAGVRAISQTGPVGDTLGAPGLAASEPTVHSAR